MFDDFVGLLFKGLKVKFGDDPFDHTSDRQIWAADRPVQADLIEAVSRHLMTMSSYTRF